jgi:aconitate decarboxylase
MGSLPKTGPSVPEGATGKLCTWIESVTMSDIPAKIQTRAKYLILDGLACALVGAHLPWSETAVRAVLDMESPGNCTIIGYEKVSK